MAAYTSNGTGGGDYDAAASWTAGSGYPGDTVSQEDTITIVSGDTISLNLTTFSGQVGTILIQSGGVFEVAADFAALDKFIDTVTIYGTFRFKTTSGTYTFTLSGRDATRRIDIEGGGVFQMDASASGVTQKLVLDAYSDGAVMFTADSDCGAVTIRGRSKVSRCQISGALTGGVSSSVTFDDDTGFEVGDTVRLLGKAAGGYEEITLSVDNGGGNWSFSEGTVTNSYLDGDGAANVTRSVLFTNDSASGTAPIMQFHQTTTSPAYFEYAEFDHLDQIYFACTQLVEVTGCAVKDMEPGEDGIFIGNNAAFRMKECSITSFTNAQCVDGDHLQHPSYFEDCLFFSRLEYAVAGQKPFTVFKGCWFCGDTCVGSSPSTRFEDCYFYGYNVLIDEWAGGGYFRNCYIGINPGGTDNVGNYDIIEADFARFENCKFHSAFPKSMTGHVISINHNQTAGAYKEWQPCGTIESDSVEARAGNCRKCDPSNDDDPLIYRFAVPCGASKTPTISLYLKKGGTLGNSGKVRFREAGSFLGATITASSGDLDANKELTPTTSWVEYDINVSSTSYEGWLEFEIEVRDDTSALLYVEDISIANN